MGFIATMDCATAMGECPLIELRDWIDELRECTVGTVDVVDATDESREWYCGDFGGGGGGGDSSGVLMFSRRLSLRLGPRLDLGRASSSADGMVRPRPNSDCVEPDACVFDHSGYAFTPSLCFSVVIL